MDEIQFIVAKLNEPPFERHLTLVDFDELSSLNLLQLLAEVCKEMNPEMAMDVRDGAVEMHVAKLVQFLRLLKFKVPTDERLFEEFTAGLASGEKPVIYPILHWALQRLPALKKRAYVARFLAPVDIPAEFMQEPVLADTFEHWKNLQEEFKTWHKQADQIRAQPIRPAEIKNDITTLEDERKQLIAKIEKMKKQTGDDDDFKTLLAATNRLRLQQDEEVRLAENMRRQRHALQQAEMRKLEAQKRLTALRQGQQQGQSAHALLEQLEGEVRMLSGKVEDEIPREIEAKLRRLERLRDSSLEPPRTKEDVDAARRELAHGEDKIASYRDALDKKLEQKNDNKLSMFRQQANMVNKKLEEKEKAVEDLEDEKSKLAREIEESEMKVSEIGGAKFMTREEFKRYGAQLREKTHQYKKLKGELAELRAESVTLHRTEQILRGRATDIDKFNAEQESRKGVSGYRGVQDKLERASEQTAEVDKIKESTLEEISAIVRDITHELKEKKGKLAPEIKKLREKRNEYQQVDMEWSSKKKEYDKVALQLESERLDLEKECDAFQDECLQEESRYHFLNCLVQMWEVKLRRVKDEEKWAKGDGRLLPNFKCYEELYSNKLTQQQHLSEQLRRQKASIEKNEGAHMRQRAMFADLYKLLACKQQLVEEGAFGGANAFGSSEFEVGGARVMKVTDLGA